MADKISAARRSENMRRIKSKGMKPELLVRKLVHGMGYRYRLHGSDLPGRPDLVFRAKKKVVFVHGCFWHGHDDPQCVDGQRKPKSNLEYWLPKLARNKQRDGERIVTLADNGWQSLVIWECEIRNPQRLMQQIRRFLN